MVSKCRFPATLVVIFSRRLFSDYYQSSVMKQDCIDSEKGSCSIVPYTYPRAYGDYQVRFQQIQNKIKRQS